MAFNLTVNLTAKKVASSCRERFTVRLIAMLTENPEGKVQHSWGYRAIAGLRKVRTTYAVATEVFQADGKKAWATAYWTYARLGPTPPAARKAPSLRVTA
jgi:hypothetical protein